MQIRLLLLLYCLTAAADAAGQDTLFLTNGGRFIGHIKTMRRLGTTFYVVEKRGFDPAVKESDVERIAYDGNPVKPMRRPRQLFVRRSDRELFTVNAPNYCYVGTIPGVSVGIEYQRFIDSGGKFSFGIGAHYCWGGTPQAGKFSRGETRINIKTAFFQPSFRYHPAGNAGSVDPSIGVSIPVGTLERSDITDIGTSTLSHAYDGSHFFVALLLEGELCFHNHRHFVFTLYGSCGPMLPAGATGGLSGQIGFKIGGRF